MLRRLCLLTTLGLLALPALPAVAKDGDRREVRVAGTCGAGARSELKVKADDGRLEVEFEVDRNRAGEVWRVVISREGRPVVRTRARTGGRSGSFSVERRIADLPGADRVTARGVGPRGRTCTASATLRG